MAQRSDSGPTQGSLGSWHNITLRVAQQCISAVNVSKHVPSFDDVIRAGPRIVQRLGSFVLPTNSASDFQPDLFPAGSISDAMQTHPGGMIASRISSDSDTQSSIPNAAREPTLSSSRFHADGPKGLGSVFSYATSKWALCCVAMAIILNRAYIFAATRRRLVLPWQIKLAIRGVPLLLLGIHARQLLQSLQCQTSAEFPNLRWGDPNKRSDLMFSHPNWFLHCLSSVMLLGSSDRDSCLAVRMIPQTLETYSETQDMKGSLGLLWPLFGTFCLSQLVETIICAVEGRPLTAETGMTLFEHSLAFAEADSAISNQLGLGGFSAAGPGPSLGLQQTVPISRSMILSRVNTPPEVLFVAFLSTAAHITSHSLGVFSLQARFRLINTTLWGLCFMASIFWSAVTFSLESRESQSLLRFPTVCIIGFIPHVLVFSGILVCVSIYSFALVLSALSPPPGQENAHSTIWQRLTQAQANLQASVSWSELRITREMDFYTALLRAGFSAISLASEAVYLNEDSKVAIPNNTWLEERRLQQLEEFHEHWFSRPASSTVDSAADPQPSATRCHSGTGFAHERPMPTVQRRRSGVDRIRGGGVGAAVRSARWLVAMDYVLNVSRALFRFWAVVILKCLEKLGVRSRPLWLLRLVHSRKAAAASEEENFTTGTSGECPSEDASPMIPGFRVRKSDQLDVETELRTHNQSIRADSGPVDEDQLDAQLYGWWLNGHTWGLVDRSGDYAASRDASDADSTSVVSSHTSDNGTNEWTDENDSRLTRLPSPSSRDNSSIFDTPIEVSDLARLLRPRNSEEQEEADALSAHLASDEILTRSRYQRVRRLQLARVLTTGPPGKSSPHIPLRPAKLTRQEESRLLEQIIISRRQSEASQAASLRDPDPETMEAPGMGSEGLRCVVCQSAARTVIVWPCRCLSLCDDCRVALAMNNFDRCVCCRREVNSFSRVYVP